MENYTEIDGWRTYNGDISLKSAKKQGNGNVEKYQHEEFRTALARVSCFDVAVDVGAHLGITSIMLSKEFDRVHAYEINNQLYPFLEHNVKTKLKEHSQRESKIILHNYGLGRRAQFVGLNRTKKSFGTHITEGSDASIRRLDDENIPGRIGFIKLDCEGYEPEVIMGAMNRIRKDKPVILYERKMYASRYGHRNDAVLDILSEEYGYELVQHVGKRFKNAVIAHPKH